MKVAVTASTSLENGDHMDRGEFHRRYEERPDIRRAELVEGVVYVPSPMRYYHHDSPAQLCGALIRLYASRHRDVRSGSGGTVILDDGNEVQPDAYLWRPVPGVIEVNADGYVEGAPQLVIEVAASTRSYDLGPKKEAYRRNGVREYLVWRTEDGMFDLFRLEGDAYVYASLDEEGVFESRGFPGLRLDIPAMLRGDDARAFAVLG